MPARPEFMLRTMIVCLNQGWKKLVFLEKKIFLGFYRFLKVFTAQCYAEQI